MILNVPRSSPKRTSRRLGRVESHSLSKEPFGLVFHPRSVLHRPVALVDHHVTCACATIRQCVKLLCKTTAEVADWISTSLHGIKRHFLCPVTYKSQHPSCSIFRMKLLFLFCCVLSLLLKLLWPQKNRDRYEKSITIQSRSRIMKFFNFINDAWKNKQIW